ncbi:HigA family addiction module antitoxin [Acaryochloris sp. CCMEE 5410]|uniref:HigA family addiction module antitoxin n=1 Tax=Acaryochloris sp. CCMEE 5410 TaxID=310037 RepID=UPI0002483B6D|nr:HigA family addiction module antitoxin [Acaryochloris sp. CCMEE 5410]KAI9129986.1 HigA family addiction module antidote protein [Acaryochloris sp. CCMEE 5410]
MRMHNPPHPGEVIQEIYLDPFEMSARKVATHLGVHHSTFARVVCGESAVTPDMAIRLSRVLGGSPKSWLDMQANYDLWMAEQDDPHMELVALEFARTPIP